MVWDLGRSTVNYYSDLPGVTPWWENRAVMATFEERCRPRAALNYARQHGLVIYERLCMNRHYLSGSVNRSQFTQDHPQWC